MSEKIHRADDEWRDLLSPEQFNVTRCAGTEPAFTGEYWDNHENDGAYGRDLRALLDADALQDLLDD